MFVVFVGSITGFALNTPVVFYFIKNKKRPPYPLDIYFYIFYRIVILFRAPAGILRPFLNKAETGAYLFIPEVGASFPSGHEFLNN